MKTPHKKKVAFYTPSKKKVRCIQRDDEKGTGCDDGETVRYVSGEYERVEQRSDGLARREDDVYTRREDEQQVDERRGERRKALGRDKKGMKSGAHRGGGRATKKNMVNVHDESSATDTKENVANIKNRRDVCDTGPPINEMIHIENELLQAYREENAFLKTNASSATSRLTGFTVNEPAKDHFIVMYSAYDRYINFRLVKNGKNYEYELIEHGCVELPDFLMEELVFGEEQLPKFFFNLMQVMVGKD